MKTFEFLKFLNELDLLDLCNLNRHDAIDSWTRPQNKLKITYIITEITVCHGLGTKLVSFNPYALTHHHDIARFKHLHKKSYFEPGIVLNTFIPDCLDSKSLLNSTCASIGRSNYRVMHWKRKGWYLDIDIPKFDITKFCLIWAGWVECVPNSNT